VLILFNNTLLVLITSRVSFEQVLFWKLLIDKNSKFRFDALNSIRNEAAVLGYHTITWYYKFIGSLFIVTFYHFLYYTLYGKLVCNSLIEYWDLYMTVPYDI
jgi:CDP-glycerol glycerophosphotransferase (TagB/SpsB family)